MCLAAACGRWDAGFEPSIDPARVLDVRRARPRRGRAGAGRDRRRRGRAAVGGRRLLRGRRSTCTSTSTCSTRTCCRRSSPCPHGLSETRPAHAAGEVARDCDVVGVEVTAFEAPEDDAERARRTALVASIVRRCCRDRRARRSPPARGAGRERPGRLAARGRVRPRHAAGRRGAARARRAVHAGHRRAPGVQELGRRRRAARDAAVALVLPPRGGVRRAAGGRRRAHRTRRSATTRRSRSYGIVAYLGMPLVTSDGERLGALCAIDHEPRQWTGRDHGVLEDLAGAAMAEVELRRANRAVAEAAAELHFAATHDSLTRLGNRRALLEDLGQLLADGARRRSRCSTCTACAASTTRTGTSPATSCWRALGAPAGDGAGRPRARLPARRRAAVRAAGGDRRAAARVGRGAARRWTSADEHGVGCRAATSSCPARRRASPPCCASRTRGWHATGMLRPLALDLEERRAAARLGGGEEKIARQHDAGQADRARADRAADRRRDVHRARHPRPPALLPARDGRARGAGRRRDHRLGAASTGARWRSPPTTSRSWPARWG